MKKTILSLVLAALCLNFPSYAQDKNPIITTLKIGDMMPDISINNIINYPAKTAKISDFKGKLLILDFWATWCGSCVHSFPEMSNLQRKYRKDLQVFLVNPERMGNSEGAVKYIVDQTSDIMGKPFKMPIVLRDTALTAYFDFYSIPHCIWIGRDGRIIAITGKPEVNAANIQKVIEGQVIAFKLKSPTE